MGNAFDRRSILCAGAGALVGTTFARGTPRPLRRASTATPLARAPVAHRRRGRQRARAALGCGPAARRHRAAAAGARAAVGAQAAGRRHAAWRTVINTHWHADQTGGNDVFGKAGAHDHRACEDAAAPRHRPVRAAGRPLRQGAPQASARADESVLSTAASRCDFGGEHIEYGYLLEAHTDGDIYVHFRDSNVSPSATRPRHTSDPGARVVRRRLARRPHRRARSCCWRSATTHTTHRARRSAPAVTRPSSGRARCARHAVHAHVRVDPQGPHDRGHAEGQASSMAWRAPGRTRTSSSTTRTRACGRTTTSFHTRSSRGSDASSETGTGTSRGTAAGPRLGSRQRGSCRRGDADPQRRTRRGAGGDPRRRRRQRRAGRRHDAAALGGLQGRCPNWSRELLQQGAKPNVRSTLGATPLAEAAKLADVELVSLLLKAKADPDLRERRTARRR